MYQCRWAVTQKSVCYEFCIHFYKQLKAIVIVIVIGKIKCNCKLIVSGINVIDPCLMSGSSRGSQKALAKKNRIKSLQNY